MATAPLAAPEQHQAVQAAVAAEVVPLSRQAWTLLDLNDLEGTLPRFIEALTAILTKYGLAASAAADLFYRRQRIGAGVKGRAPTLTPPRLDPVAVEQIVADTVSQAITDTPEAGLSTLDTEAEQLVLDQGRRMVMSTAQIDREAKGWARVTEPGACSFCLMLAMRGPVYRTHKSASFLAHRKKPNGSGGDCRCQPEPVFGHYEAQAAVRDAAKVWAEVTKGRTGHDARTAFRQAIEGRPVTGAKGSGSKSKSGKSFAAPKGKTAETQRAQLKVLQAMPPAKTPQAAQWRAERIAEIHKFLGA